MGGIDSHIEDFHADRNKERVTATPSVIDETFKYGQELINKDYLPEIKDVKYIQPYLKGYGAFNLYTMGWRFQFGSSREWAGLCDPNPTTLAKSIAGKNIYVSIQFVKHDKLWKENMRDTILHEIAHAIVFELFWFRDNLKEGGMNDLHRIDDLHKVSKGHGMVWKAVCKALSQGENDCRIHYEKADFAPEFNKYRYDCSFCGHEAYGKTQRFASECEKCGKPIFVEVNKK